LFRAKRAIGGKEILRMDESSLMTSNGSLPLSDEQRRSDAHLREMLWQAQRQRLHSREWFDFASDGFLLTDSQGVIYEANYATAALFDARKEFVLGKPLGLFMTEGSRRAFYIRLSRLVERGGVEQWEARVCRPRGEVRDVMMTATLAAEEQERSGQLRWILRDISGVREKERIWSVEKSLAERAWLAEKSLADSLLDAAEIFIFVVNESGRILRCNPYVEAVSGYRADELRGRNWEQLLVEEERSAACQFLLHAAEEGSGKSGILAFTPRHGPRHSVIWSARKLGDLLLLIGYDVTELLEAQRHALRAERLAALGEMASGLVHESRNALQRSQACLSLLALRLEGQPEALELSQRVQKAQEDLQRLFEDVRTYAAGPRLKPCRCDLRAVWREAWSDLIGLMERPRAELQEDLAGVDPYCLADPFALKQVFRNLLDNALSSGALSPRVVLHCRPAMLDAEEAICIRVRDNGRGIAPEVRARLFEPFFSTKVRGTGLGLAICKRIVEAHGGRFEAGDDSDSGAEFILTLPRRQT
jgi:two-component system sensor kinase FixL